ncbi:MAG: hypothetical protein ACRC31_05225, partial [Cetobacterium sp.]
MIENLQARNEKIVVMKEIIKRRIKARASFFEFIKYVSPWIPINDYIEDVCKFIDILVKDKINGKEPKGLLEAPVRHMKSILISQHVPAYWIGLFPTDSIITASSSDKLLEKNSRRMESIIRSQEYINLFGDAYSKRENGIDRKNTSNEKELFDGIFQAYTVGGGILGAGSNLLIIDDPFKNTKQAFSLTEQSNVWEWYQNDILSRLEGNNALLIMHQRLHVHDLAGKIKEQEDFHRWHYRSYKAIKDDGTALHEDLVPLSRLLERKKSSSNFDAMYQQSPVEWGGNIIKSSWFNEWDVSELPQPKFSSVYLVCDTALKSTGDYWVIMLWGRTKENDRYLIDIYREKKDYGDFKNDLRIFYETHKKSYNI